MEHHTIPVSEEAGAAAARANAALNEAQIAADFEAQRRAFQTAKAHFDLGRPPIEPLNEAIEDIGRCLLAVANDFGAPIGPDEAEAFRDGFELVEQLWRLSAYLETLARARD